MITWKRSTSSRSSSSRNPLTTKDDVDDSGSDFVEEFCMISGSHSSTLDRLYAWERKLYDEVKVCCRVHFLSSEEEISDFQRYCFLAYILTFTIRFMICTDFLKAFHGDLRE